MSALIRMLARVAAFYVRCVCVCKFVFICVRVHCVRVHVVICACACACGARVRAPASAWWMIVVCLRAGAYVSVYISVLTWRLEVSCVSAEG